MSNYWERYSKGEKLTPSYNKKIKFIPPPKPPMNEKDSDKIDYSFIFYVVIAFFVIAAFGSC